MSKEKTAGKVKAVPILPPPTKRTCHMTVMAATKTVATVVEVTDKWTAILKLNLPDTRGAVTRQQLENPKGSTLPLALNAPSDIADRVTAAVEAYKTNTHEILAWCVNRGATELSAKSLVEAFPGRTPSFSLAGVFALAKGLDAMAAEFRPTQKASDGSSVGGRVNGGRWSKRKPKGAAAVA